MIFTENAVSIGCHPIYETLFGHWCWWWWDSLVIIFLLYDSFFLWCCYCHQYCFLLLLVLLLLFFAWPVSNLYFIQFDVFFELFILFKFFFPVKFCALSSFTGLLKHVEVGQWHILWVFYFRFLPYLGWFLELLFLLNLYFGCFFYFFFGYILFSQSQSVYHLTCIHFYQCTEDFLQENPEQSEICGHWSDDETQRGETSRKSNGF